jgi:hypothetical protein
VKLAFTPTMVAVAPPMESAIVVPGLAAPDG